MVDFNYYPSFFTHKRKTKQKLVILEEELHLQKQIRILGE